MHQDFARWPGRSWRRPRDEYGFRPPVRPRMVAYEAAVYALQLHVCDEAHQVQCTATGAVVIRCGRVGRRLSKQQA
jgi:hypothetical protein